MIMLYSQHAGCKLSRFRLSHKLMLQNIKHKGLFRYAGAPCPRVRPCVPRRKFACLHCKNDLYFLKLHSMRNEIMPTRVAGFQTQRISNAPYYTFPLIVGMQDLLIGIQDFTGLPWWATIMSATVVLRLVVTLPLAREQAKTVAKIELLQPTINEVVEALKHNITIKGKRAGKPLDEVNREFRMEARFHMQDIYKRNSCHPLKLYLLPWVQLPLWILISLSLRNLSGFFPKAHEANEACFCHPDLLTGGIGWITDLTVSDPYFLLPAIIGVSNLLNIELNTLRKKDPSKRQIIITRIFRTLTITMVFFAAQVPTAMSLYWATSSSYGLAQNLLLMQPAVRRKLQIPWSPSESTTPIRDKLEIFKTNLDLFMQIQRK